MAKCDGGVAGKCLDWESCGNSPGFAHFFYPFIKREQVRIGIEFDVWLIQKI